MKLKLLGIAAVFSAVMLAAIFIFFSAFSGINTEQENADRIVALNEIERLSEKADDGENAQILHEKIAELQESLRSTDTVSVKEGFTAAAAVVFLIFCLFLAAVLLYIYNAILKPFEKLRGFADEIARGNFNIPLDYERSNYFGAFTWAFDNMRLEITKARAAEKEAIENNKTVIATLSHDIKTPLSSIRAYAEGLEANIGATPEKRQKYLSVIMRKCDEVTKLADDLFIHSLSDLDKLKIHTEKVELFGFMRKSAELLSAESGDIKLSVRGESAYVMADEKRLIQILENLVNNSRKYAKTEIAITAERRENAAIITVSDSGGGIPDEDIPFIFGKFYRGKNCASEQGSGLGLYIVQYLTVQMGGEVRLRNNAGGLEVKISLPIAE